jgi:FMN phosphatase YigB (HAD superfamily)
MSRLLASLDVGGTLGVADGPGLASTLVAASPLNPSDARRAMRETLHNQPEITTAVIVNVCKGLQIPTTAFPTTVAPTPLRLFPGVGQALRSMSRYATLVTLSNVTCLEADTEQLLALLSPWVVDHFPSCRIGYAKPDPAAFHHVATAFDTSTANMVHIGDDWICDVVGARSAGVTAIWISNGRAVPEPERLDDPDVLVADDLAGASHHLAEITRWRSA